MECSVTSFELVVIDIWARYISRGSIPVPADCRLSMIQHSRLPLQYSKWILDKMAMSCLWDANEVLLEDLDSDVWPTNNGLIQFLGIEKREKHFRNSVAIEEQQEQVDLGKRAGHTCWGASLTREKKSSTTLSCSKVRKKVPKNILWKKLKNPTISEQWFVKKRLLWH